MSRKNFTPGILVLPLALFSIQAQPLPPDRGTANVSGVVTSKGDPACGVWVEMVDQGEGHRRLQRHIVVTDEKGRFHIERVAAGKFWITARAPGHTSPGNDGSGTSGQSIDVAEGAKIENIALEIKRGGVIAVRITDSRGNPAPEEEVSIHRLDKDGWPKYFYYCNSGATETRTDDRGVYRFYGLPEGRYLVSVGVEKDSNNLPLYAHAYYPNVIRPSDAKAIEVTFGSETNGVDITLPDLKHRPIKGGRTNAITIRLVTEDGVGLPNAKVDMTPVPSFSILGSGGLYTTDENGIFKFHDTGPKKEPSFFKDPATDPKNELGSYWLRVSHAQGYAPKHPVHHLVGDDITVTMIKGGVVTGRITNAKGEPVIRATIRLVMARDAEGKPPIRGGVELVTHSDDRGVYRFWGLTPGTYVVITNSNISSPFGCSGARFTSYRPSSTPEKAAEVTVKSGVETGGIDIRYR